MTSNGPLGALTLATLLALALACRPAMPTSAPHSLLQAEAPAFARPTLTGESIDTAALRGQVVVIKFFAKWCHPCQRTLPEFERIYRDEGRKTSFIGISEDERSPDAQAQVDAFGLSFPVVMDREGVLAARFRVREMPMTFVLDRQGVVRWVGGPEQTGAQLAAAVAAAR